MEAFALVAFIFMVMLAVLAVILIAFLGATVLFGTGFAFALKGAINNEGPSSRGDDFLADARLRPWSPDAFADLSSRWKGWWRASASPFHASGEFQGIVQSMSRPADPGWVAFTVLRKNLRNAIIKLHTTQHQIEVQVTAKNRLDPNTTMVVHIDGETVGSVSVRFPEHTIADQRGRPVATIRTRGLVILRTTAYVPVTVGDKEVGKLTDIWIRQPSTLRQPHPAWTDLRPGLTDEQQRWMLVWLAIELYYDSLWKRSLD